MRLDLNEYTQFIENRKTLKKSAREAGSYHVPELLRQAAVQSDKLTKSDAWNAYLSRIQKDIERAAATKEAALAKLIDPKIINHDDIMSAKIVYLQADAMINALKCTIEYPSNILNAHKTTSNSDKGLNNEED